MINKKITAAISAIAIIAFPAVALAGKPKNEQDKKDCHWECYPAGDGVTFCDYVCK